MIRYYLLLPCLVLLIFIYIRLPPSQDFQIYNFKSCPVITATDHGQFKDQLITINLGPQYTHISQDIVIHPTNQDIYCGLVNGSIIKIENNNQQKMEIVFQNNMIVGMQLSLDQKYIFYLDAIEGLCKLNIITYQNQCLFKKEDKQKFKRGPLNALAQAKNGIIYMTQPSQNVGIGQFMEVLIKSKCHGSVYSFNPQTQQVLMLQDNLCYPNGIVMSNNEQSILIAETGRARITQVWLDSSLKNRKQIFLQNLPGNPDNMKKNQNGQVWVALPTLRDNMSDWMFKTTFLRRIVLALGLQNYSLALSNFPGIGGIKLNIDTKAITHQFYIKKTGQFYFSSTVREQGNKIYLSSILSPNILIAPLQMVTQAKLILQVDKNKQQL